MELTVFSDEHFMKEALKEANKAFDQDEVPVGVVVVANGQLLCKAHEVRIVPNPTSLPPADMTIASISRPLTRSFTASI